ncbi:MAG TPA: hypothetical protein VFL76_07500 [Edaphocola sp.]|nr:hypothetical protein [Edaphocola sp.]
MILLTGFSIFCNSCTLFKKLHHVGKGTNINTKNNHTHPLQIDVQDIYKKMPHSIVYNLGDSVKLYLGQSTYSYADSYLVVHIPITDDSLSYMYGAKYASRPDRTLVYAVRFFPDNASLQKKFSGEMKWINFQNWKAFGLKYRFGKLVAYMAPVVLARPEWEDCLVTAHALTIDQKGKIVPADQDSLAISLQQSNCKGDSSIFSDNRSLFLGMQRLFSALFIKNSDSSGNWRQGSWLGGQWYPCTSMDSLPFNYHVHLEH